MRTPQPAPEIADIAPVDKELTAYDRAHLVTYMRLLDAEKAGADWREVARLVLGIDPAMEEERARRAHDTHLARARWLGAHGYRDLLKGDKA